MVLLQHRSSYWCIWKSDFHLLVASITLKPFISWPRLTPHNSCRCQVAFVGWKPAEKVMKMLTGNCGCCARLLLGFRLDKRRGGGLSTVLLLSIYPKASLSPPIWDSELTASCANIICLFPLILVEAELNRLRLNFLARNNISIGERHLCQIIFCNVICFLSDWLNAMQQTYFCMYMSVAMYELVFFWIWRDRAAA